MGQTDSMGTLLNLVYPLHHSDRLCDEIQHRWVWVLRQHLLFADARYTLIENVKISVVGGVCSVGGGPKIFALIFIFPVSILA
jgi:hypothetical protein